MDKKPTKRQVINKLKTGLKIHQHWSEYLRADPKVALLPDTRTTEEVVGGVEWHDEWAAIYERAIEFIESK